VEETCGARRLNGAVNKGSRYEAPFFIGRVVVSPDGVQAMVVPTCPTFCAGTPKRRCGVELGPTVKMLSTATLPPAYGQLEHVCQCGAEPLLMTEVGWVCESFPLEDCATRRWEVERWRSPIIRSWRWRLNSRWGCSLHLLDCCHLLCHSPHLPQ
jgi:hypothetical protein